MWFITTQMVIQLDKKPNKYCHSKNHLTVVRWSHRSQLLYIQEFCELIIIYNHLWNLNYVSLQQNKLY